MTNELQALMKSCSSLKALQILVALNEYGSETSIKEISQSTDLSESTIHRILQDLVKCGFVEKKTKQKLYGIGFQTKLFAMNINTSDTLIHAADKDIKHLNDISKETVNLIVLDGYEGVYAAKAEAQNQIRLRSKVGWKIPLHCTSGGKLLLAYQDDKWLTEYFSNVKLKEFTKNSITDQQALKKELHTVREQGYAMDLREHNDDIICIAAPIFGKDGEILGAISISAPEYRFPPEKALSFKEELLASAFNVSARYGYGGVKGGS